MPTACSVPRPCAPSRNSSARTGSRPTASSDPRPTPSSSSMLPAAPASGGDELPPLVDSAQAGAAEVLYGLGASLGRRGGDDIGLVYLQLALYLMPQHGLTLLSLADIYEGQKNYALAIKVYERVPKDSPLRRNADIQIAVNLDSHGAHRGGEETAGQADCRTSDRSRSDHGARHHPARAQTIRRMRRRLRQGHRHHREAGEAELGDLSTTAASATSARRIGPRPRSI